MSFKSTIVTYEIRERLTGESYYLFSKIPSLTKDCITSLSAKPISIITVMGMFVVLLCFVVIIYSLISKFSGHAVDGCTSMTCILCFVSGIQLMSLGVIGEYISAKLIWKQRPDRGLSSQIEHINDQLFK